MLSPNKERELLQLQCKLARLKIASSYHKQRQMQQHHQQVSTFVHAITSLSPSAWQLALLPKQKKYRLLIMGLMALTQVLKKSNSSTK